MIVRKLEALFTINTNAVQFKKAASHLDGLASKAEAVMKAIAGYWAVQALQNFVTNTANAMAEVGKSAEYLGITAEALQELHYAAEKSGVSVDALNDALKEIQIRATDAQSGKGEAAEAFKKLFNSTDLVKQIREPLELLDAVADRLKTLPTHGERLWVADAIFGDEGSMVLKMLKEGSLGLRNMRQEARALGLTLDSDSIAKANRFNQALTKFKKLASGMGRTIVENLLPPLTWLMEKCSALSNSFDKLDSKASVVRVTLLSLGGALAAFSAKAAIAGIRVAIAFAPTLLFFGLIAAAIAAVVLVIDDLWGALHGEESAIGKDWQKCVAFFNGLGASAREAWRIAKTGLSDAWQSAQREFSGFSSWLSRASNATSKGLKDAWTSARREFDKYRDFGSNTYNDQPTLSFADGISSDFKPIKEKIDAFRAWLEDRTRGLIKRISKFFDELPGLIEQRISDVITIIKDRFTALIDWLSATAELTKRKIYDFFAAIPDAIKHSFTNGLTFIEEKFAAFCDWITGAADGLKNRLANVFDGLMPDFVKKGFLATIKHVSSPGTNSPESPNLNARLAPTPANVLNQNRVSSNQSVNVAVNVNSGANPQEIGAEVAKVFKKEFERERFNAFMGVSQYVG